MKEKRYEIIKRKEREVLEGKPVGINAIGGPNAYEEEILKRRGRFESPKPRSSPVNANGVQMQQGRDTPEKTKIKK